MYIQRTRTTGGMIVSTDRRRDVDSEVKIHKQHANLASMADHGASLDLHLHISDISAACSRDKQITCKNAAGDDRHVRRAVVPRFRDSIAGRIFTTKKGKSRRGEEAIRSRINSVNPMIAKRHTRRDGTNANTEYRMARVRAGRTASIQTCDRSLISLPSRGLILIPRPAPSRVRRKAAKRRLKVTKERESAEETESKSTEEVRIKMAGRRRRITSWERDREFLFEGRSFHLVILPPGSADILKTRSLIYFALIFPRPELPFDHPCPPAQPPPPPHRILKSLRIEIIAEFGRTNRNF